MSRWALRIIVLLAFGFFVASAKAGHIWHDTGIWGIPGPGGYYGLVEVRGDPISIYGQMVYETVVCVGPLQFELPCRAPFAICLVITALAVAGWLLYYLIGYWRRAEVNRTSPPEALQT